MILSCAGLSYPALWDVAEPSARPFLEVSRHPSHGKPFSILIAMLCHLSKGPYTRAIFMAIFFSWSTF